MQISIGDGEGVLRNGGETLCLSFFGRVLAQSVRGRVLTESVIGRALTECVRGRSMTSEQFPTTAIIINFTTTCAISTYHL
jgi:hypothetical protein